MISLPAILFYLFSGVLLGSALMVVTARNTVHGVLFLILAFLNAAGLFVLLHAEFLAMILVIVYVGAVAVLFLFVVMMINLELGPIQAVARRYSSIGVLVGGVFAFELMCLVFSWKTAPVAFKVTAAPTLLYKDIPNTQALGNLLYTHYVLIFQAAGFILLIAMIGAILLTMRSRKDVRSQKVGKQLSRQAKESVRLVNLPKGLGLREET